MPKIKTHSGAKKRFTVTKTGKLKYSHTNRRHILNKKAAKRMRHLRKEGFADQSNVAQVKRLLPYA
jgi:large subunit ribosomal protein L35